ncbi:hypothetical protein ACB092_12G198500 [Castanea dentata]
MACGLKGVENVYTQHQPLLFQTMESISKGRLRDVVYPYVGNHFQQGRPQKVVIFSVGGTTYEDSRSVALQNASNSGIRFILSGSVVLNSKRENLLLFLVGVVQLCSCGPWSSRFSQVIFQITLSLPALPEHKHRQSFI